LINEENLSAESYAHSVMPEGSINLEGSVNFEGSNIGGSVAD
jgi:hypothetical protein